MKISITIFVFLSGRIREADMHVFTDVPVNKKHLIVYRKYLIMKGETTTKTPNPLHSRRSHILLQTSNNNEPLLPCYDSFISNMIN